jgi:lipopolysaccharide/colanic/teichoic acid biosynthesis glycosyltransferase
MYKLFFKRLIDIVVSFVLLCLLAVPFMLIAIAIYFDDGGPIFFRQVRIGKNGKEFKIFKWKTMLNNSAEIGPFNTQVNDPRVTKTGRILRKTSIDELPQLINVLIGDMSLIGPRPDVPRQKVNYTDEEFDKRHSVLPGMTGLAQSRNRHNATNKSRKTYDIFYTEHINFLFDVKIVWWTLKTLTKGSY